MTNSVNWMLIHYCTLGKYVWYVLVNCVICFVYLGERIMKLKRPDLRRNFIREQRKDLKCIQHVQKNYGIVITVLWLAFNQEVCTWVHSTGLVLCCVWCICYVQSMDSDCLWICCANPGSTLCTTNPKFVQTILRWYLVLRRPSPRQSSDVT